MTDHPAFRRALAALGGSVGDGTDPTRGDAVRERARRITGRRRAVVAGTAALALIAGGVVVAWSRDRAADRLVATSDSPTPDLTEQPGGVPTPTVSSSPSSSPSGSAPGSVGPGAAGASVTLHMAQARPTGGESVIEAHVVDPDGGIAAYNFSFDDDPAHPSEEARSFPGAGVENYTGGAVDRSGYYCQNAPLPPSVDEVLRFSRTFRVPGTYTAVLRVRTRSCAGIKPYTSLGGPVLTATLRYTVTGRLWPNGPDRPSPTLDFRRSHWEPPDEVDDGPGVQVVAIDDGDFASMRIDWGDGTSEPFGFGSDYSREGGGFNDCAHPNEFGESSQRVIARPDHTYASSGSYQVTVVVTSASCDGTDQQTASATGTYVWPDPSATPFPTPATS